MSSSSAKHIDLIEISATMREAAALFGETIERLEELESTLLNGAELAARRELEPRAVILLASVSAGLARATIAGLSSAKDRFSMEADRYEE